MIGSVSGFSALSYLDQVKGVRPAMPVARQPEAQKQSQSSPDSPLQSGDGLTVSPDILSLLQDSDANSDAGQGLAQLLQSAQVTAGDSVAGGLLSGGKDSPIGGLLGTGSVPSALGGLLGSGSESDPFLSTLLAQGGSAKPFEQAVASAAQAQANQQANNQGFLANLGAYHAGFSAYNKVLQQNANLALQSAARAQESVSA